MISPLKKLSHHFRQSTVYFLLSSWVSQFFAGSFVNVGVLAFAVLLVDDQVLEPSLDACFSLAEEEHDLVRARNLEHGKLELLRNGATEKFDVFFLGDDLIAARLDFANHVGVGEQSLGLLLEGEKVRLGALADVFHVEGASGLQTFKESAENKE